MGRGTDESDWWRHRGDSAGLMVMKGKAEEFVKGVSQPKVNKQY